MSDNFADRLSLLLSSGNWATVQQTCIESGNPDAIKAFKAAEIELSTIYEELASRIKSLEGKVPELENKVENLHNAIYTMGIEMKKEKRKNMRNECKMLEKTLIVNGLPIHPLAIKEKREESQTETREQIQKVLQTLDVVNSVTIESIWRIKSKTIKTQDGKDFTTNATRITLSDVKGKFSIFKSLVHHGDLITGIKISESLPRDMIPLKRKLEKISAKWRTNNKQLKTRVISKNGELIIMMKDMGKKEEKYTKANSTIVDNELSWLREEIAKNKKKEKKNDSNDPDPDSDSDLEEMQTEDHSSKKTNKRKPSDSLQSSASKQKV